MIGDTLFVSLLVALIGGGRLANLAKVNLQGTWVIASAAVVQYGGQWLYDQGVQWIGGSPYIYMVSLAAVLYFVWLNRSLSGIVLAGLGVLCNVLAITANGGQMPVSVDALSRAGLDTLQAQIQSNAIFTHVLADADTKLRWLGDIFALTRPYPRPKVFSIGDIILALGVFHFIVTTLRPWPLRRFDSLPKADESQAG